MTLTGAPDRNPQTGAEFIIRLWLINGTSRRDLKPEAPEPKTRKKAA